MVSVLQQEETIRDLRRQIDGLSREDEQEVIFRETSARRGLETLYRMTDGEPVRMKLALARRVIHSFDSRGKPKWTTDPSMAPTWKLGEVKCFLHPESEENLTGILAVLGLAPVCDAGNLRNQNVRLTHGSHCHKQEWAAYQAYLAEKKEEAQNERQERQLEATLALAGRAAASPRQAAPLVLRDVADVHDAQTCDCGWSTDKGARSMSFHKRMHCPLKEASSG